MATPGQLQMYNKLEISEMFGLDHRAYDSRIGAIRRIAVWPDEKVPDAAIFKIWLEDHTLGNILRMELLRNENVLFAGYKVPHPLDHMIELRLQTLPKSSPQAALRIAVRNLRGETQSMLQQFDMGVAALRKGEKHKPEIPRDDDRRGGKPGRDVSMSDADQQSSDHGAGGGTSDDMARRTVEPGGEDEDTAFQDELEQLKRLETFGGGAGAGYSPAYSPTSPLQEGMATDTPGGTPGLTPGRSPGLTPGPSPGPGGTPGLTPGRTPGLTPGRTPGAETPGDVDMEDMA